MWTTIIIMFCGTILLFVISIILMKIILKLCIKRCESKASMVGKIAIITGSNSGIGFETAKDLAARGCKVILACRNESRGMTARDRIITETGNDKVLFRQLDLSSLDCIRKFAQDINAIEERLDVLVNNAGVYGYGDRYTKDDLVEEMQVNYFGAFLLTLLLLPLLKKSSPSRIVNLSSVTHYFSRINIKNLNKPSSWTYPKSKLCNVVFTLELARRLKDTGVTVNAVHPGIIMTNITHNAGFFIRLLFGIWCWICQRTVSEGAQTVIYLCVSDECINISGKYFVDCKPWPVAYQARGAAIGTKLWRYSAKVTGYKDG